MSTKSRHGRRWAWCACLMAISAALATPASAESSLEACESAFAIINRGEELEDDGLSICEDAADDTNLTRADRMQARLLASRLALAIEHAYVADLQAAAIWVIEPQFELPTSGLSTYEEEMLADAKKRVRLDPPLVVTFSDPYTLLEKRTATADDGAKPAFKIPIRDRYELVDTVVIIWSAEAPSGLKAKMRVPMQASGPRGPERVWSTPVSDPLAGHSEAHDVSYRLELKTAAGDVIRLEAANETVDAGQRKASARPAAAAQARPSGTPTSGDPKAAKEAPKGEPKTTLIEDGYQLFMITGTFLLPLAGLQLVVALLSGGALLGGLVTPQTNPGLAGLNQITAAATGLGGLACLVLGGASVGAAAGLYALDQNLEDDPEASAGATTPEAS